MAREPTGRVATHARVALRERRRPPALLLLTAPLLLGAGLYVARANARADPVPPAWHCHGAVARVPPAGLSASFLGHACRDDECAAHKAGFAWADRNGITDPSACDEAEDPAFADGCRVFAVAEVTAEQAGFAWARDNALDDPCRCDGAGPRFAAGCEAFVKTTG